jgi:putative glycosyltransferase (TIGR04348 family)
VGGLSHLREVVKAPNSWISYSSGWYNMKIQLITPSPLRFNNGNKITAVRWVAILRQLGHEVALDRRYNGGRHDVLIALHARRSYPSIRRFHEINPDLPLIVVLTGTDLYRDLRTHRTARRSLELATRIVALQPMALVDIPKRLHKKTRIIYQSAQPVRVKPPAWEKDKFRVCLIGHLRAEKDPLRAAMAVRRLPPGSRIEVVHIGRALNSRFKGRALAEAARNPRYRWLGELSHARTRKILAESHLAVITSRIEGSSNVLSEAIASSVPVVASKIPGLVGTLGKGYPGYFPVGDSRELSALLVKAESDRGFYRLLKRTCARLARLVNPAKERRAWRSLLREIQQS